MASRRSKVGHAHCIMEASKRVRELGAAVRRLALEAKRLQANLERLHEMQCVLAAVTKHLATWMERVEPATPTHANDSAHFP